MPVHGLTSLEGGQECLIALPCQVGLRVAKMEVRIAALFDYLFLLKLTLTVNFPPSYYIFLFISF